MTSSLAMELPLWLVIRGWDTDRAQWSSWFTYSFISECSSATGLDALIPSGTLRESNNEISLKPPTDRARPTQRGKKFSVHSFIEQHPSNRHQRPISEVKGWTANFKQCVCGSQGTFQKDWKWEKREIIIFWVNRYHAPWRNQNSSKYYRNIL